MKRLALAVIVAVLVGTLLRMGFIESRFIYHPERQLTSSPADAGLDFEEVALLTSDGVPLHGWFVPGRRDVTWLWLHGNAGNIGDRVHNLRALHQRLGVNVFLFDYRGYGKSEGRASEGGTYRDAEAALAYLLDRPDSGRQKLVYFGRSMGASIAAELALRHPPSGLILESPLPSIQEMARRAYPFLPIWPLLRTKYDTVAKVRGLHVPLLVLHGDRDDIIPIDAGRKVFDAANEPKRFSVIPGAGHNDTYVVGGEAYWDELERFVASLEQAR